jgi:hypothetical protein
MGIGPILGPTLSKTVRLILKSVRTEIETDFTNFNYFIGILMVDRMVIPPIGPTLNSVLEHQKHLKKI